MTRRWTTRAARTVPAPATLSQPGRRACAAFGLVAAPQGAPEHTPQPGAAPSITLPPDARVVLLTGHSGSGKSTLLRTLARHAARPTRVIHADHAPADPARPVFDAVDHAARAACPGSVGAPDQIDTTLGVLAAAGLAEPMLWPRPIGLLSAGESARVRLARAMASARRGDTLLCDEFASNLDRASAGALAHTAARWARRAGVRLIVAAAHEDMPALLAPDLIINAETGAADRPAYPIDDPATPGAVRVGPGTPADYQALSRYHYLGGRPATMCRVLRAVRTVVTGDLLAGVLVVSMPTFNGVWRRQAWPGRYEGGCKRAAAARMNRELRCISRVIVEPRSRGLGVASALVRAYLADPLSPATEAVAAMGAISPFFRAAGMREYRLPRPAHDARLADALDHARLDHAQLINPRALADPFIARELARWAKDAKVRAEPNDPLPAIARHAVCRLASRPRAYATTADRMDAQ